MVWGFFFFFFLHRGYISLLKSGLNKVSGKSNIEKFQLRLPSLVHHSTISGTVWGNSCFPPSPWNKSLSPSNNGAERLLTCCNLPGCSWDSLCLFIINSTYCHGYLYNLKNELFSKEWIRKAMWKNVTTNYCKKLPSFFSFWLISLNRQFIY